MSSETEALATHLASLKLDASPVDWKSLTDSQTETTKAFEALGRQIFALKDNLSKNFVCVLKELKDFDLKDLATKAAESKAPSASLKNLATFATVDGTNVTLKLDDIKEHVAKKQTALIHQNATVQAKLFETAQWIDSFVRGLNTTKDSSASSTVASTAATSTVAEGESVLSLEATSNKKFDFPEDKLNDIVSKIQVTYIPETKNFISIQTY